MAHTIHCTDCFVIVHSVFEYFRRNPNGFSLSCLAFFPLTHTHTHQISIYFTPDHCLFLYLFCALLYCKFLCCWLFHGVSNMSFFPVAFCVWFVQVRFAFLPWKFPIHLLRRGMKEQNRQVDMECDQVSKGRRERERERAKVRGRASERADEIGDTEKKKIRQQSFNKKKYV